MPAYIENMSTIDANQEQPEKLNAAKPANATTTPDPDSAGAPHLNELGEELLFKIQVYLACGLPSARITKLLEDIESGKPPQPDDFANIRIKQLPGTFLFQLRSIQADVLPYIAALERPDLTLSELRLARSKVDEYHKFIEKILHPFDKYHPQKASSR